MQRIVPLLDLPLSVFICVICVRFFCFGFPELPGALDGGAVGFGGAAALLVAQESQRAFEAIQVIAHEGITLLWSDLDDLADSDDTDIAYCAREALERLCEDLGCRRR